MRIYKLLHQIVHNFSAMDESEALELHGEAEQSYKEALQEAKSKEKHNKRRLEDIALNGSKPDFVALKEHTMTVQDKIILASERWYIRYGFGILYIVAVPIVREYMNGGSAEEGEEEQEGMMDAIKFFTKYQKMKKS